MQIASSPTHGAKCGVVRGGQNALRSLQASQLRSVLTLFGIILATTTLIAVMSVIEGMNVYIADI